MFNDIVASYFLSSKEKQQRQDSGHLAGAYRASCAYISVYADDKQV